jgi:hypothetical protein
MTTEAIAVPTKRGRPKKAAITEASPLEPSPRAKGTTKKSKGPATTAAAAEAAPKANGRTRKKATVVEELQQPKETTEILERAESVAKVHTKGLKGKRSPGEATKGKVSVSSEELKEKEEPRRAPSESAAERSAKVLEIGEAIIEEGKTIRQLRRLYQYQVGLSKAEEPSSSAPRTVTELKADALSIPIVPGAPSLEDTTEPVAVTSPPSTVSPATQAVDVPVIPTPPSLADPPQPALVPPHALTSNEPPHQVPLQQSKILTALAGELQHQDHRISPAASPDPIPSAPSSIKQAPGTNRMAPGPSSPSASRKPHSAPPPLPQPGNQVRKAHPRIPFPSPTSASPIPVVKPDKLKSTLRKYTMVMVALPIAIVTSWALFERCEFNRPIFSYLPEGPGSTYRAEVN